MQVDSTVPDSLLLGSKRVRKCFSALWLGHAQATRFQDVAHLSNNPSLPACVSGTTEGTKRQQGQMAAIFTCDMFRVPYQVFETK